MLQQTAIQSPSCFEDLKTAPKPSAISFSETPSEIRRVLGWLGLVMGCGFALLGCMVILAFVPGMTPTEHTPGMALFAYCLGGFFIAIGAVTARLAIPAAYGWPRTITWNGNQLVAAHGRRTRTALGEKITGVTVGRGASSPIVVRIAGEKPLEIPRSLSRVGDLAALVDAIQPVATDEDAVAAPSPVPTTPSIPSGQSWDQARAQTMAHLDGETASMSTKAKGVEPPLWCIKLLTGGLAFVGMAFYLHLSLFPRIASGERSLDACWFGYAMLYQECGPTLAVYLIGGIGLLLAVGGMIGIGATTDK